MITLKKVSCTYDGASSPTLRDVTMSVEPGEMVALMGAQHSGTSTLCRLISGVLADHTRTDGTITGRGTSGGECGAVMLGDDPEAQLTGMVTTVDDEVRLPGRLWGIPGPLIFDRAAEAMQRLQISALAPRSTGTLSGGERQLTALASLLTVAPGVLVLDQPGLALDAAARTQLIHVLQAHCADGGSVLLASHQHDELTAACDRAVFLESGRITHQGPIETITEDQILRSGVWWSRAGTQGATAQGLPTREVSAQGLPGQSLGTRDLGTGDLGTKSPDTQSLTVERLSVERGGARIIEDLSWTSGPGSVTSILGPNGSGKSTVLRALAGLLPRRSAAVSGAITLTSAATSGSAEGEAIAGEAGTPETTGDMPVALEALSAARRAPHIAWVGQDPGAQISAATVRRELDNALPQSRRRRHQRLTAGYDRDRRIAEVLTLTDLAGVATEHPYDLTPAQRKDLVIATALLMKPAVLLLDEPTLGRDGAAMTVLTRVVTEVAGYGGAVVLTTHDHSWAEHISDQLITLPPHP